MFNGGYRYCDVADISNFENTETKIAYRYRLAEQLHIAVLDRLLDPKNVKKGEFSNDLKILFDSFFEEERELFNEVQTLSTINPNMKLQRVIEECGDVAAYLAAIIDAVKEAREK